MQRMLTGTQAARELGHCYKHVYELAARGLLPGAHKTGRVWRIPMRAVVAYKRKRIAQNFNPSIHESNHAGVIAQA